MIASCPKTPPNHNSSFHCSLSGASSYAMLPWERLESLMSRAFQPLQFLLVAVAGWVNRDQQKVIDYLLEENHRVKDLHGGRRLRLTDDQRRRLAVKGKALGRKLLSEVGKLVTPDTLAPRKLRTDRFHWILEFRDSMILA